MSLQEVIVQLESIRANSSCFIEPEESDSIWQQDIDAIDEVIVILKGMEQESKWKRILRGVWPQLRKIVGGDVSEDVSGVCYGNSTTQDSD